MYIHVPTSPPCKVCQHYCSSRSDLLTSCCASETTGICTAANESRVGGKKRPKGGEKC